MIDKNKLVFRRGLYSIFRKTTVINLVATASYVLVVCGCIIGEYENYYEAKHIAEVDNYGYDVLDAHNGLEVA